jgi:CubicO group peptidase (beta-lactamase class C family)
MTARGPRSPKLYRAPGPQPLVLVALLSLGVLTLGARPAPAEAQAISEPQLSMMLARNAKQLCSAIFVVGRTPEEAMALGDVIRWELLRPDWWDWDEIDTQVDLKRQRVTLGRYPAPTRSAVFNGRQGCTMLAAGEDEVFFEPVEATPKLPPADETPWPMGDRTDGQKIRGINRAAVEAVLDAAYQDNDPERGERGWVVLHEGVIVAERYGSGYDMHTRNLSFSAGKSVQSTLVGILVHDGHLDVNDAAPISEWEAPDARSLITIKNLLQMASGLGCDNFGLTHPLHFTPQNHHSIGYNDGINAFQASVAPPLRFVPGTVNRYRNCDMLAVGGIVRKVVEKEYDVDYLAFPQRALFDRIGVRNFIAEPDPYGNFLFNGHDYVTTRDWARFGLLYQQDGVFNGERILAEGWADFVSTPSAANPGYGAFFWLATEEHKRPRDAYWASGAEGQQIVVLPSHGVVIARNAWSPTNSGSVFDGFVAEIADAVVQSESDCRSSGWRDYGFEGESQCLTYVGHRE